MCIWPIKIEVDEEFLRRNNNQNIPLICFVLSVIAKKQKSAWKNSRMKR